MQLDRHTRDVGMADGNSLVLGPRSHLQCKLCESHPEACFVKINITLSFISVPSSSPFHTYFSI